jgi:hypothetical protein
MGDQDVGRTIADASSKRPPGKTQERRKSRAGCMEQSGIIRSEYGDSDSTSSGNLSVIDYQEREINSE